MNDDVIVTNISKQQRNVNQEIRVRSVQAGMPHDTNMREKLIYFTVAITNVDVVIVIIIFILLLLLLVLLICLRFCYVCAYFLENINLQKWKN